ncbi:hypothetical protein Sgleb_48040 [Streptomyces glebosus]|uniref:Uncharacterized protein n=1 Tax=Streptomyces glebosus TaxID=249580 RepID=A0A640SZ83_9ACTN|nr:hypothetical protein Sgleb_48040 [Streptomyces glebosus]
MAAADEFLRGLVEVRQHVEHHPGGLTALKRCAAHQVVQQVFVRRFSAAVTAFEHP